MLVSTITAEDLEAVKELQPEGWPDIMEHISFYVQASYCHPLKFEDEGNLVGIGAAISHGNSAWLGHIIVHKDHRNKGFGQFITQTLVARLDGYATISLIATELGAPIYRKIGFQKQTEYHFFKNEDVVSSNHSFEMVQDFDQTYLNALLDLDKRCSGEDRSALLLPHLPAAKISIEQHELKGFYLPNLGEGLVVSPVPEIGVELLHLKLQQKPVAVLPQENEAGLHYLTTNGYSLIKSAERMYLGNAAAFKGKLLFNRIGGKLG